MSDSQPPRYENYPDEPTQTAEQPEWPRPEMHQPPLPVHVPSSPQTWSTTPASRRGVVGGVLTAAVVVIVGAAALSNREQTFGTFPPDFPEDMPEDDSSDTTEETNTLEFGDQGLSAPDGWTIEENSSDRAVLSNGRNQLMIVIETTSGGTAAEELRDALDREDAAFVGKLGTVKLSERNGNERATMSGSGKYQGKPAHQLVELILDDDGESALFFRQILATPTDSTISKDSARLMADVRQDWPW